MKRNKPKMAKVDKSMTSAAITGIAVTVIISILLLVLVGNLILNGHLSEGSTNMCVFVIRMTSLITGILVAAAIWKKEYLKLVGIVIVGYLLILITIGIVFFDGSFKNIAINALSAVLGGVVALGVLLSPKRNKRKLPKISI